MRILLSGGASGGHVNPALAIAAAVKNNIPDAEIAFVGTPKGIENKLIPAAGYPLHHIEIQGLRRKLSLSNLKTAYLVLTSPKKAKKIIKEFKPDIVVGTGGYVCWPVVRQAARMGIPTAVHESNAYPGVAVKMLAKCVDRILLNFKESSAYLEPYKDKLMYCGNPLMGGFSSIKSEEAREELGITGKYKYFILSYGGSLGAENVNTAVLDLMNRFVRNHPEILHVHATGAIEYEEATRQYKEMGLDKCENTVLLEYIYDMPKRMAAADLVICRAGAMTVSEIAMAGKCAVFIPSPNVAENHQYKNAKVLEDAGAAILIEEKNLTGDRLLNEAEQLLSDAGEARRQEMSRKVKDFCIADANKIIYNELMRLIQEKKKNK